MHLEHGMYKNVFIFKKWVIKLPRFVNKDDDWFMNFLSPMLEIWSEQISSVCESKKVKRFLLPVYFIPFIPISLQRRVDVFEEEAYKLVDIFEILLVHAKLGKIVHRNKEIKWSYYDHLKDDEHTVFNDISIKNIGCKKDGSLVKIDYGDPYNTFKLFYKIDIFCQDVIRIITGKNKKRYYD